MAQVVIENPILNSPYHAPTRHFRFGKDGITDQIDDGRRVSSYFSPIAKPKKKGGAAQLVIDSEWTQERIEENKFINDVRARVDLWRRGGYQGVTTTTRDLLDYWQSPERDRPLFFCQIEALETVIYLTECATKFGDAWIENALRSVNAQANPLLMRMALKLCTGAGKTLVMGMLIAWHALNKAANPQDGRFSDAFLLVAPGITIRDRLRVLIPGDAGNYYRALDLVPPTMREQLGQAKIVLVNYHAFKLRETQAAGRLTKGILGQSGGASPFQETPDQMVRRVCREMGTKKNIVVINDEAHHCYRHKPDGGEAEKLVGEERAEAQEREEAARLWISGLEAVKQKLGIRALYDLSATPFFLRGSGYPEGTLFPWVVSDFSLIDGIEAGIVKVPRVPVSDNSGTGEMPPYRDLWPLIRDGLPKKKDKAGASGAPKLPVELESAMLALYGNYEKYYRLWDANQEARDKGMTPPVFIIVCNNTFVSKMVFDYIAGWEKSLRDGSKVLVPGGLAEFSNVENGQWTARPKTILVDSAQLDSGEGMTDEFKRIAAREIAEFKADYQQRFPGRSADDLTEEDLLREVMNTVGKPGKLGEHVRCVVSVSMLTEGWDANTVTHILGVRAFGTQLLCEQVVGRALRRISYSPNDDGHFDPEYAEVFGVPFSFIPCSGSQPNPKPGPIPTRVRTVEGREACEITFPRVQGYRFDLPTERLTAKFSEASRMTLTTEDIPVEALVSPIIGQSVKIGLDDLKTRRPQEVVFKLAKFVLENHFPDGEGYEKPWLFPQLLDICRRWLAECVTCKDHTFPQLLLLIQPAHEAAKLIYESVVESAEGEKRLKPILRPYGWEGSTRGVDLDTIKPVYQTDPQKCHLSHVVCDSGWEGKMAETLEDMAEVRSYVKNQNLDFKIPYTFKMQEHNYIPDFLVRIDDGHGADDLLTLIVEVSGQKKKAKKAKTDTARALWVPAINNHGGFGRWAFLEITDPWDAQNAIRKALSQGAWTADDLMATAEAR